LNTSDNYTLFFDTGGEPAAYNVSASVRWAFVPKRWSFPIVGTLPYLGYFDRDDAILKVRELRQQGHDVFWYALDAYSTLDFLPNPVFSRMLRRSDLSLIETVIHELLHGTVWHSSDTTFNESLATWVGRTGAMDYLAARYPDEPDRVEAAAQWYEDTDRYNAFLLNLYTELDAFYAGPESRSAKINGREALFQAGRDRFAAEVLPLMNRPENFEWAANLPTNNAWLLANVRYNSDLDVFERVHQTVGRDWAASLAVFHAAAGSPDPFAYLRAWLADNPDAG
jgi:predicted aminopeptidase